MGFVVVALLLVFFFFLLIFCLFALISVFVFCGFLREKKVGWTGRGDLGEVRGEEGT